MGFRNNATGYPQDLLASRSIIKKNNYALIEPNGLVKNVIPGFDNCDLSILASPKLGASFVDYLLTMHRDGKTTTPFGANGIETFAYVLAGTVEVGDGVQSATLDAGGYIFVPAELGMTLTNVGEAPAELFLYKRRYKPIDGHAAHTAIGNVNNIASVAYEDMEDVRLTDLLPTNDLGFDMNFHILSFAPGASHGYLETHVQEHGALILEGEGLYNLDNEWIGVRRGDYIFMASYCVQGGYGVGRGGAFSYLYSKDCNRDEEV